MIWDYLNDIVTTNTVPTSEWGTTLMIWDYLNDIITRNTVPTSEWGTTLMIWDYLNDIVTMNTVPTSEWGTTLMIWDYLNDIVTMNIVLTSESSIMGKPWWGSSSCRFISDNWKLVIVGVAMVIVGVATRLRGPGRTQTQLAVWCRRYMGRKEMFSDWQRYWRLTISLNAADCQPTFIFHAKVL